LDILAIEAFNLSSTVSAAILGSMVVSDPGARVAGGESAAWAETATHEAVKRSTAQNMRSLRRVVSMVHSSFDRNTAQILPSGPLTIPRIC
jgi:hypothetical protein